MSVDVSQCLPEIWASLIAKFTVEDDDGSLLHVLPNGLYVIKEYSL